jgi:anaerobic C4-dicarboxylate transporter
MHLLDMIAQGLVVLAAIYIAALLVASFVMSRKGLPLSADAEYQRRLAAGTVGSPTTMDLLVIAVGIAAGLAMAAIVG